MSADLGGARRSGPNFGVLACGAALIVGGLAVAAWAFEAAAFELLMRDSLSHSFDASPVLTVAGGAFAALVGVAALFWGILDVRLQQIRAEIARKA